MVTMEPVKKIPIDDVRIGMHIEDVLNEKGLLLFSVKTAISSEIQIERLKKRGVKSVFIIPDKSETGEGAPRDHGPVQARGRKAGAPSAPSAYRRELCKARQAYLEIVAAARQVMNSARAGTAFHIKPVKLAVDRVIEKLTRQPDVLVAVSQLMRLSCDEAMHGVNVCVLSTALAHALGYRGEELENLAIGAMLHDIGKMRLPEDMIDRQGRLTGRELDLMRRHPGYGVEMVRNKRGFPEAACCVVGQHHERYNGQGYPQALSGNQVSEAGYIGGVCDAYDSMTAVRMHREAQSPQEALALLFQGCNADFPRPLVEHFTRLLGIYPVGSLVKLESGEAGLVIRANRRRLMEPTVLMLFDSAGGRYGEPFECDLSHRSAIAEAKPLKISASVRSGALDVEPGALLDEVMPTPALSAASGDAP